MKGNSCPKVSQTQCTHCYMLVNFISLPIFTKLQYIKPSRTQCIFCVFVIVGLFHALLFHRTQGKVSSDSCCLLSFGATVCLQFSEYVPQIFDDESPISYSVSNIVVITVNITLCSLRYCIQALILFFSCSACYKLTVLIINILYMWRTTLFVVLLSSVSYIYTVTDFLLSEVLLANDSVTEVDAHPTNSSTRVSAKWCLLWQALVTRQQSLARQLGACPDSA